MEVKKQITAQNWEYLFQYDQLRIAMGNNSVLRGFLEGKTNFAPTYKYDVGSDNYDSGFVIFIK
jgi:hypothetical protein